MITDPRPTRPVPCNGCTACCQGDAIYLHPECGDDPSLYETEPYRNPVTGDDQLVLKHAPNGDCYYLERGVGCTIWSKRPVICREFDCRLFYKKVLAGTSRKQRGKMVHLNVISKDVLRAGRKRLGTL